VIAPALEGKKFDSLTAAAEANVRWQADQLLTRSEILRTAHEKGDLRMLRGIYDVETGVVRFID
jgi:carbonic anhydrase